MTEQKQMSFLGTPRWWLRDLAIQAKLNEKFYTHKFGCWCAAIGERLPQRRGVRGNRFGSLLLRLPLAKWTGVVLAITLIPCWVRVTLGGRSDLRREYQMLYIVSWLDQTKVERSGDQALAVGISYPIWTRGGNLAEQTKDGAIRTMLPCSPKLVHYWLVNDIYHGSIGWLYLQIACWSVGVLVCFWIVGRLVDWRRRVKAMDGIHRRGARLVGIREWNAKSIGPFWRRKRIGMFLRVSANGDLAKISSQAMTTHWLNLGKTGSGKTVTVSEMLDQAEANDWVVVVSDAKRELLRTRYSSDRGDWAVDPGLKICPRWALEREVKDGNEARSLSAGVFPDRPGELRFFRDWAEKILAKALDQYSEHNAPKMKLKEPANTRNVATWLRNPKKHLVPRLGTGITAAMNPGSGDQSAGMEGMLARAADGFAMMPMDSDREFCIREWVEALNRGEQPGWIFFPTGGPTEKAVKPVITAMLDMLLLRLRDAASLGAARRQVLVVLDEVTTSFDYMEQLKTALTNLRSFGVMVIVGIHDQGSLDELYGHNSAKTIGGQAGVKAVFGTDEPESQEYASKCIGFEEIWRLSENFPGRPLDPHRSLNFNLQVTDTPLVSPAEIGALEPLQGYLVHRGFVTPLKLSYRQSLRPAHEFEERLIPYVADEESEDDGKGGAAGPSQAAMNGASRKEHIEDKAAPVDDVRPQPAIAKRLTYPDSVRKNPLTGRVLRERETAEIPAEAAAGA